jgi:serine/threonine-protein kinase
MTQGTPLRLTSEPGDESNPVWTPDGTRIAFGWRLGGTIKIFWKSADGTGEAEELSRSEYPRYPRSFSPDGKMLAFVEAHPSKLRDIWTMPVSGDRKARPFQATNADEWAPQFSRDGRWIAFVSNETGRNEIYVRPAAAAGARKQVSTDGGIWPVWSHNRKEIFYLNDRKLMSSAIDPQSGLPGKVSMVLELMFQPRNASFDVMPDDEHFFMTMSSEHPPTYYNVILNWFSELQQRVTLK